ncbi:hypothetical protein HYH03_015967 [Edaphochlamys debaryana]|uniref:FAD-binding domain-containing protein n=1 Tax=Edaphochlamys debaryana TaxID=47281 RepID=A0A836BQR0_9CHLO|nr:hypothetical protein HYH03_015967 [Edaphochlamys debaryana]|eukprot:KAG2485292.1 hypothetical protein HYH03_015967 [Edaphochlamys debaryana]
MRATHHAGSGHAPTRASIGQTHRAHRPAPRNPRRQLVVIASSSSSSSSSRGATWSDSAPVLVSGAGIAGLATAAALAKVGIPVRLYEQGPGLRQEGAAIGLWANAWRALDAVGAGPALRGDHLLLNRVQLCSSGGEVLRSFGFEECDAARGPTGSEFRGVRRAALLQALYDQIPEADRVVTFGTAIEEVLSYGGEQSSEPSTSGSGGGAVAARLSDGRTVYGSALVGADGVGSVVARRLGLARPNYAGYVALRGVAEFPSAAAAAGLGLPTDTIRQIWGEGVRAGLYPVTPTSMYWYVCYNLDEQAAASKPSSAAERQRLALGAVKGWAWGVEEAIRSTPPEDITFGAMADRWTRGAFGQGCVTLAGDAAHPMTPNLGQGGCTALEDAVVLARSLREAGSPQGPALAAALRRYEEARSGRCFPLTARANLMGAALQIPLSPVCTVRNAFVRSAFKPAHFMDHTTYDCGTL